MPNSVRILRQLYVFATIIRAIGLKSLIMKKLLYILGLTITFTAPSARVPYPFWELNYFADLDKRIAIGAPLKPEDLLALMPKSAFRMMPVDPTNPRLGTYEELIEAPLRHYIEWKHLELDSPSEQMFSKLNLETNALVRAKNQATLKIELGALHAVKAQPVVEDEAKEQAVEMAHLEVNLSELKLIKEKCISQKGELTAAFNAIKSDFEEVQKLATKIWIPLTLSEMNADEASYSWKAKFDGIEEWRDLAKVSAVPLTRNFLLRLLFWDSARNPIRNDSEFQNFMSQTPAPQGITKVQLIKDGKPLTFESINNIHKEIAKTITFRAHLASLDSEGQQLAMNELAEQQNKGVKALNSSEMEDIAMLGHKYGLSKELQDLEKIQTLS